MNVKQNVTFGECEHCGTALKPLATSVYCPNEDHHVPAQWIEDQISRLKDIGWIECGIEMLNVLPASWATEDD